jgi:hypothetical protein
MANILLNRTGALGDVFEVTAIVRRLKAEGNEVAVRTNYHPSIKPSTSTWPSSATCASSIPSTPFRR